MTRTLSRTLLFAGIGLVLSEPAAADYAATVLADNPVAYWRLGEANGPNAASETGAHTGTYTGTLTYGVPGALALDANTAVDFDQVAEERVTVLNNGALQPANLSLEAWVNPSTLSAAIDNSVMTKTSANAWNTGYGLSHMRTNAANAFNGSGDNIVFWLTEYDQNFVIGTLPLNQWSHVVGTYDGTNIRLYIDAVEVDVTAYDGGGFGIGYNGGALYVADAPPVDSNQWDGSLDELAVYNTTLSAAQVQAHFDAASAADPVALISLTGTRVASGVEIEWVTGTEIGLSGFEVLRCVGRLVDCPVDRHSELGSVGFTPARGGLAGAAYRVKDGDAAVTDDYTYLLVAHDVDGTNQAFGPVALPTDARLGTGSEATALHTTAPGPLTAPQAGCETSWHRLPIPGMKRR